MARDGVPACLLPPESRGARPLAAVARRVGAVAP